MKSTRPVPAPHAAWLLLFFLVPVAVWVIVAVLPIVDLQAALVRRVCRNVGYLAAACLLATYLYTWRRLALQRRRGHLTRWMRWHIGSSYLACGLTVIHVRGHWPDAWLTSVIVWLLAIVMLSGMLGYFGQKLVYRFMSLAVGRELGRDRLESERLELIERADRLVGNRSLLTEYDINDWGHFCLLLIDQQSKLHQAVWENKLFSHSAKRSISNAVDAACDHVDQDDHPAGQNVDQRLQQEIEITDKKEVIDALNGLLIQPRFCKKQDFGEVAETDEVYSLLQISPKDMSERQIERRNRLFLEAICGDIISARAKLPESVQRFFDDEVLVYLRSPFPSWGWVFTTAALQPVPHNHYLRVKALVADEHVGTIQKLWEWIEQRRQMDREYWLHRVATAWLWLHTPAAGLLFALVVAHILSSIWYGGLL